MNRLTTDTPKNNEETLLNYIYYKDGEAYLRYADNCDDYPLNTYISNICSEYGVCGYMPSPEEVPEFLSDPYGECYSCHIGILWFAAVQAVKMRGRLKQYEDALEGIVE